MDDLRYIKKHYGEKMAQYCSKKFPTILETPGKLAKIMSDTFFSSKRLYHDIVNNNMLKQFEDCINKRNEIGQRELPLTNKTPFELMEEAGYELYECKTEEEIQVFRKYYDKRGQKYDMCRNEIPRHVGEELCTFDGERLKRCYVFFAVKKDAEKLRREDFKNPRREDDYGISVISLQFSRNNYTLSIKNRYNHTVYNPDATFGNNLENIIPGLTRSFEEYFGQKINQVSEGYLELPNYIEVDGKSYKYNYEIGDIYYCPNNIIIKNGEVIKEYAENQERYIVMDYFVLDIKEKKLFLPDESLEAEEFFTKQYENIGNIIIQKTENKKVITITTKEGIESKITINNQNQIIGYENNQIEKIEDNFLVGAEYLEELKMPNLQNMGKNNFYASEKLEKIVLPKLQEIGDYSFYYSCLVQEINLPSLIEMGASCFYKLQSLQKIYMPELERIGNECFSICNNLKIISLPKLQNMGIACFYECPELEELNLPSLKRMDSCCFGSNTKLQTIYLPEIESIKEYCFNLSEKIEKIDLPKLQEMENFCFHDSSLVQEINMPELIKMGKSCFNGLYKLENLSLPKLKKMGTACFHYPTELITINLPEIEEIKDGCFMKSIKIKKLFLPELDRLGSECFNTCDNLKSISLPKLQEMRESCFMNCPELEELNLPIVRTMHADCFAYETKLQSIYLPSLKIMGNDCFFKNYSIKKIDIPDLQIMQRGCFESCYNLEEINAPDLQECDSEKIRSLLGINQHIQR